MPPFIGGSTNDTFSYLNNVIPPNLRIFEAATATTRGPRMVPLAPATNTGCAFCQGFK